MAEADSLSAIAGLLGMDGEEERRKRAVWEKALVIPSLLSHPDHVRRDALGNTIRFDQYGNANSPYGWDFDHFPVPRALGGGDDVSNLRPLHCSANRSRGALVKALINRRT
jgi:hypothetical protein